MVAEPYRYVVGGTTYKTTRLGVYTRPGYGDCLDDRRGTVPVHYLPGSVGLAVAAPEVSLVLWLYWWLVGLPLLIVLAAPAWVGRHVLEFARHLPPLSD